MPTDLLPFLAQDDFIELDVRAGMSRIQKKRKKRAASEAIWEIAETGEHQETLEAQHKNTWK